jgi:hypothetical protein
LLSGDAALQRTWTLEDMTWKKYVLRKCFLTKKLNVVHTLRKKLYNYSDL